MNKLEDILKDANWCLGCIAKPCSNACPMHTKIPEFIEKIKENDLKSAYQLLIENNVFTHVCSLICPQENQCEGSCIRSIKQESTKIGKLEKFVNEWAISNNIEPKIPVVNNNFSKKVAIIGSGPAGLSCAFELAKNGIKSTVFEKENELGGVLYYGIPDFRLKKDIIENIIKILKSLGIKFKLNCSLGKDITIESLKKEYDYVFIGIGAEVPSIYKLTDESTNAIFDSDIFLRAYNYNNYIKNLGEVVVIGGGNVAMDVARSAVRMGAKKVSILYRRDREHMPARNVELDEAITEGINFVELTRVLSANVDNEKIKSLNCIKTQIVDGKAQDIKNSEFIFNADTVVFAIGLSPNKELLVQEGLELTQWGTIKVDEENQTNIENVYCGGDVLENKSVVCKALASGKKAAESIFKKANGV